VFVLATAGHVDHGKSTLLKMLTGMEPDRLPEEKKRGLTIHLNFLWADFEPFGRVGFVDVPGHHRFVGNMLGGVSEVSGYILVVAADDGWMPQTEEHLLILKSFQIQKGILVISKVDRVPPEAISQLREECLLKINSHLGTRPPVLTFSQHIPESTIELRNEITKLLSDLPKPHNNKSPRLWVDRAFVPKGLGVVVTGTLTSGSLHEGQPLSVWPGNKSATVKSLQSYQTPQQHVGPVSRVAVQLSQISHEEIPPGSFLSGAPFCTHDKCDGTFHFFSKAPKKNIWIKAYSGTLETECLIIPNSREQETVGRIQFSKSVPLQFGDRWVLRSHGEELLLGFFVVRDPLARSANQKTLKDLHTHQPVTVQALLHMESMLEGFVSVKEVATRSRFTEEELTSSLKGLQFLEASPGVYINKSVLESGKAALLEVLSQNKSVSLSRLPNGLLGIFSPRFKALLAAFGSEQQWWAFSGDEIRKNLGVLSSAEQTGLRQLEKPPGIWSRLELIREGVPEETLSTLIKRGLVISLKGELFISEALFQKLAQSVEAFLKEKGSATTSELKSVLGGVSRKYAIPLLEKMDEMRVTFLKGGVRQLLKNKREG